MEADEIAQLQAEEVEVLVSIFEGDSAFCPVSASQPPFHFQYKLGADGSGKSALMDVRWGERYPETVPDISFEAFYNRHIPADVKQKLIGCVLEQAEGMVGMSMTYTLIEYLKENIEELLKDLPEDLADVSEAIKTASLEEKGNAFSYHCSLNEKFMAVC
jgi:hypothetical protein